MAVTNETAACTAEMGSRKGVRFSSRDAFHLAPLGSVEIGGEVGRRMDLSIANRVMACRSGERIPLLH